MKNGTKVLIVLGIIMASSTFGAKSLHAFDEQSGLWEGFGEFLADCTQDLVESFKPAAKENDQSGAGGASAVHSGSGNEGSSADSGTVDSGDDENDDSATGGDSSSANEDDQNGNEDDQNGTDDNKAGDDGDCVNCGGSDKGFDDPNDPEPWSKGFHSTVHEYTPPDGSRLIHEYTPPEGGKMRIFEYTPPEGAKVKIYEYTPPDGVKQFLVRSVNVQASRAAGRN